jgi:hypothetical protein
MRTTLSPADPLAKLPHRSRITKEFIPRTKSISDFLFTVCKGELAIVRHLMDGDWRYLELIVFIVVVLNHVDCLLHLAQHQVAMAVVCLRTHQYMCANGETPGIGDWKEGDARGDDPSTRDRRAASQTQTRRSKGARDREAPRRWRRHRRCLP